jgi:hypothetical protein
LLGLHRMGWQFDLVELCILIGKVLHGIKSQWLLCGRYFTLLPGKSLKTKKDCRQSFLCCVDAGNYSGFISKVRQGGKERTTQTVP